MLVKLVFRHGRRTIGESDAGFVPTAGMLLHLENVSLQGRDVRWRVVSEPMPTFSSRGMSQPDKMRPGPVYVQVEPATVRPDEDAIMPDELRSYPAIV